MAFGGVSRSLVVLTMLLCSIASTNYSAELPASFAAYKRASPTSFLTQYELICEKHQADHTLQGFQEWLLPLDELVERLSNSLRCIETAGVESILTGILDAGVVPQPGLASTPTLNPLDALMEYGEWFRRPLPLPNIPDSERDLLRQYYGAMASLAEQYIVSRGYVAIIGGYEDADRVLQLCIVIPLLQVADGEWTAWQVEALPDWMRQPERLQALAVFALHARRPLTAHEFALAATQRTQHRRTRLEYLEQAAVRLASGRDYLAAIACLRTAIRLSAGTDNGGIGSDTGLHLRLAEIYDAVGHSLGAAEAVRETLVTTLEGSRIGKGVALRLRYLYQAGRFGEVLQEATLYQGDDRCRNYLPYILYVQWATHRRLGEEVETAAAKEAFLERFPGHPLAAEVCFASAMDALVSADYAGAQTLLKTIADRFPDSRHIRRVREIQDRLHRFSEGDAHDWELERSD